MVSKVLVVGTCKKTKLIYGHNLLVDDYLDHSVEHGRPTGLLRVMAMTEVALAERNLVALPRLLAEANRIFLLFGKSERAIWPFHIERKIWSFLWPGVPEA